MRRCRHIILSVAASWDLLIDPPRRTRSAAELLMPVGGFMLTM